MREDGWALLARMAANAPSFDACGATAQLAGILLLRTQLVQGVRTAGDLAALREIVGVEVLAATIADLAGFEALRVMANLGEDGWGADPRTPENARRRLAALAHLQTTPQPDPNAKRAVVRTLHRHQSIGARRIRHD